MLKKGQKAWFCVLGQKNTPDKGKENPLNPAKICWINARSMHLNSRYIQKTLQTEAI